MDSSRASDNFNRSSILSNSTVVENIFENIDQNNASEIGVDSLSVGLSSKKIPYNFPDSKVCCSNRVETILEKCLLS